jgi:RNA polymerase sigma-70 factor (ECF subfamily)
MDAHDNKVNLDQILDGCRKNHRASQQRLYAHFYNYAMTVARRYTGNAETAEEVANDAFFKVFTKIHLYAGNQPFRPWFRRVIINTAIDRVRAGMGDLQQAEFQPWHEPPTSMDVVEHLTREQVWAMLDQLPPAYRTVFNLAVVDGFSHEEIAAALGISVGASKSNLSRARQHLKTILSKEFEFFG